MSPWVVAAIIIIAIGLIATPLVQLIPTEKQKIQQVLRQAAIQLGLNIQIRSPDIEDGYNATYPELKSSVAYFLLCKNHRLSKTYCAVRSKHHTERWFWTHGNQPEGAVLTELHAFIAQLPEFILAIEVSASGAAFFWQETGDINRVETISTQLKTLNQLIAD